MRKIEGRKEEQITKKKKEEAIAKFVLEMWSKPYCPNGKHLKAGFSRFG